MNEDENIELEPQDPGVESEESVIAGPELKTDAYKAIEDDLQKLPYELSEVFDRIAPGLGGEVFKNGKELAAKLLLQLASASERDPEATFGDFEADNTEISDPLESMKFGEISNMVSSLNQAAAQLEDLTQEQDKNNIIIDMDSLSSGEARSVQQLWGLVSGEAEVGAGHVVEVGPYTLSVEQGQAKKGMGAESRKLVIRKTDQAEPEVEFLEAA